MDEIQIQDDSATQTIIENSLDDASSKFLIDCDTAFEMIKELRNRFEQSGPSKLYETEYKIKTLKLKNNDCKLYLDNLNTLFDSRRKEADKFDQSTLDEQTKVLFAADELVKIGIHPINLIQFKDFNNLKNEVTEMELFIKRYKEIKKIDINQNQDSQVNNIKKNINNNSKNKIIATYVINQDILQIFVSSII